LEEDYVERNSRIIEDKMIWQTDEALEIGKNLVNKELSTGLLDFFIKPVVKTFYSYWSAHDAREGTLKQIRIALECAKLNLEDGESEDGFLKIIEEHFPDYLDGDQTYRQCKKKHINYEKLKQLTKDIFITQVQEAAVLLKVKEDIETYEDLCRVGFSFSKEKAFISLMRQLDYNDEAIKIVERDHAILKVPTGKNIVVRVLRKGFDKTKNILLHRLDLIFDGY
jgi:hypothetical protein